MKFDFMFHFMGFFSKNYFTIDLCLPYSICSSPKSGNNEKHVGHIWIGSPIEQNDDADDIDDGASNENRDSSNIINETSKTEGTYSVYHSIRNQDVSDVMNSPGTWHKTLRRKAKKVRKLKYKKGGYSSSN